MAAMQGANVPGADSRCLFMPDSTSSLSTFLRVAKPANDPNLPYINLIINSLPKGKEPIDSLQKRYDKWKLDNQNPFAYFSLCDDTICSNSCVDFTNHSTNNPISWLWKFPGGTPANSTIQNPSNICFNSPGNYIISLISTNSFGSDTATQVLTVLTCTSMQENKTNNPITIYPNPAHHYIVFELKQKNTTLNYQIELYNSIGALVSKHSFVNADRINLPRESLATGVYFYKLSNGNGAVKSGKFIFE